MSFETELNSLIHWTKKENYIERIIIFSSFGEALAKMVEIGIVCDKMDHHPEWTNSYNELHIKLTTHDANGITMSDILLAKAIDKIIK